MICHQIRIQEWTMTVGQPSFSLLPDNVHVQGTIEAPSVTSLVIRNLSLHQPPPVSCKVVIVMMTKPFLSEG